jgi:hypothetical protein
VFLLVFKPQLPVEASPHQLPKQPRLPTQKPQQNPQRNSFSKGDANWQISNFIGNLKNSITSLPAAAAHFLSARTI